MSEAPAFVQADRFDFQDHAGLISKRYDSAIRMRLLEVQNESKVVVIDKGSLAKSAVVVFSHKTAFPASDALLLVSPWVRVDPGTPANLVEELRRCSLSVSFNGAGVFGKRPIGPYLLPKDPGQNPAYPGSLCFVTGAYEGAQVDLEKDVCNSHNLIGVFLPTNTPIEVTLTSDHEGPGETIRITAGLTCARYTGTRPEIHDLDVREFGETGQLKAVAKGA